MLRAMIFNRSVLVLMIVSLPTSMAAAGPIFTHPIQPAGASPWVQGNGSETRAMLSGSGSDFPGGVLWVDVRPSRLETLLTPTPVAAASGAVNPPTVPTVAVPASSSSPGEDSAASSQAGILSVSTSASPQAIDASGRAVDGPSTPGTPAIPSSRGVAAGQAPMSPGALSSYQASPAGVADHRSTRMTGGTLQSAAATPGPASPAAGVTTFTASPTASIPQAVGAATGNTVPGTTSPQAGMTTSPPGPGAAIPAAGGSPLPGSASINPGIGLSASGAAPSIPQTPSVTTPATTAVVASPQDAGTSSPISATTAAILAASGPMIPSSTSAGQGATGLASNAAASTSPSSSGTNGPAPPGATSPTNPTPSVVSPIQVSNSPASSGSPTSSVGGSNLASFVPIALNNTSPAGASADPVPSDATAGPLNSAIGVTTNVPPNPGAASAILAPTPLSVTDTLPLTQASLIVAAVPDASESGGGSGSGVAPQSLPEPGTLTVFATVLLALVMKRASRRRTTRVESLLKPVRAEGDG